MFGFGKKVAKSNPERYGQETLDALKSHDWRRAKTVFLLQEQECFSEASVALGQLYASNDNAKSIRHFKIGADRGNAEAAWGAASTIGHDYIPDYAGKDKEWYGLCLQAANGGCGDAMNELGNVAHREEKYLAAYYWFQMAGFYEHPTGGRDVELLLKEWDSEGRPVLENSIDGVCSADIEGARLAFSVLTRQRKFDEELVRTSMKVGAQHDNSEFLQLFVGDMCEIAFEDFETAKIQYQIAAHNNSIIGMRRLGDMLAYGKGCEKNLESAFSWYPAAAKDGERVSQYIMGQVTRKQNPNLAAYWFMSSYRRGYQPAMDELMKLVK